MEVTVRLAVDDPSGVGAARRAVDELGRRAGLDASGRATAKLVATELAANLTRHASRGELLARPLARMEGLGLDLVALDRGPGIPNVAEALRDGYSTGGSPGTGLGAVMRAAQAFDLATAPAGGTAVLARIAAANGAAAAAPAIGAVCVPIAGESVSGDAWAVVPAPDGLRAMVVDGVGHGAPAAEAAARAVETFQDSGDLTLLEVLARIHEALRGSRGAAVALAEVDRRVGRVRYTGAGNVAGAVVGPGLHRGLASMTGTAGHAIRSPVGLEYPFPPGSLLVMHSDGCKAGWSLEGLPGLRRRHPAVIAALIWRDWARGRDDATVLAIRCDEQP